MAGEIWRQRAWIWVPALLFFLVNAGAFAVYTLGYAGQVRALDDRVKQQAAELREINGKRAQMETMIASVRTNEEQVEQLYADRLSTRSHRLTSITTEVKRMAKEAGLVPRSISYPEQEIQDYGLIKRSFIFSVGGTYANLRKFITLLERSHSFLTLDEATVANEVTGPELRIDLTLSTLFARDAQDEPPASLATGATAVGTMNGRSTTRPSGSGPSGSGGPGGTP
jgi:Tfp pilus assembly protein PilO